MIENVIGVLGLPVGLGLNFLINGRDYVAPHGGGGTVGRGRPELRRQAGAREAGGFTAEADDPVLIGQIQVLNVPDPAHAAADLLSRREEIIRLANSIHPRMVARGGGVVGRGSAPAPHAGRRGATCWSCTCWWIPRDAMGANLVQQHVRGRVGAGGEHERRPGVHAHPLESQRPRPGPGRGRDPGGAAGRQGAKRRGTCATALPWAAELAAADPYRAATHNKGHQ